MNTSASEGKVKYVCTKYDTTLRYEYAVLLGCMIRVLWYSRISLAPAERSTWRHSRNYCKRPLLIVGDPFAPVLQMVSLDVNILSALLYVTSLMDTSRGLGTNTKQWILNGWTNHTYCKPKI